MITIRTPLIVIVRTLNFFRQIRQRSLGAFTGLFLQSRQIKNSSSGEFSSVSIKTLFISSDLRLSYRENLANKLSTGYSFTFSERLAIIYNMTIEQMKDGRCYFCHKTKRHKWISIAIHHIDRDRSNNEISNLMILCEGCHMKLHGAIYNRLEKVGLLKRVKNKKR